MNGPLTSRVRCFALPKAAGEKLAKVQAEHEKADEGCKALKTWFGASEESPRWQMAPPGRSSQGRAASTHGPHVMCGWLTVVAGSLLPPCPPRWFGEDMAKTEPEDVFSTLHNFVLTFQKAHKYNREQELRKKKQEQMAKAKAAQVMMPPSRLVSTPPHTHGHTHRHTHRHRHRHAHRHARTHARAHARTHARTRTRTRTCTPQASKIAAVKAKRGTAEADKLKAETAKAVESPNGVPERKNLVDGVEKEMGQVRMHAPPTAARPLTSPASPTGAHAPPTAPHPLASPTGAFIAPRFSSPLLAPLLSSLLS